MKGPRLDGRLYTKFGKNYETTTYNARKSSHSK